MSHFFLFGHIHNRLLSQGRDSPEDHPGKGKAETPTTARNEEIEAAYHKNDNINIQIVSLHRNKVKCPVFFITVYKTFYQIDNFLALSKNAIILMWQK